MGIQEDLLSLSEMQNIHFIYYLYLFNFLNDMFPLYFLYDHFYELKNPISRPDPNK